MCWVQGLCAFAHWVDEITVVMGCAQLSKAKLEPLSDFEGGSDGLVSGLLCWDEIDARRSRAGRYACSCSRKEGSRLWMALNMEIGGSMILVRSDRKLYC